MRGGDLNLKNHIHPLTCLDYVEKVIIVRDQKGPELNKVEYHCPPKWSLRIPPINFLIKFLLMLGVSLKEKNTLVLGFLFFPHGLMAFLVGKLTRKKVGVTLISGPVEVYGFIRPKKDRYIYSKDLPPLKLQGKVVLKILKMFDFIIVGGNYSKKFLMSNGVDEGKIFVLYKHVDEKFKQEKKAKIYDCVYVGRLVELKHVETIIKAVSVIKNHNRDIKIAIVGDGPERAKLEKMAEDLEVKEEIDFVGWRDDPWNWFNVSKLSIMASEREGFPQAIVQSLNCGIPVICSICGDICDLIENGNNGILVEDYNDVDSFAKEIIRLLNDQKYLDKVSHNSIKTANEYFNIDIVTKKWRYILSKVGEK